MAPLYPGGFSSMYYWNSAIKIHHIKDPISLIHKCFWGLYI